MFINLKFMLSLFKYLILLTSISILLIFCDSNNNQYTGPWKEVPTPGGEGELTSCYFTSSDNGWACGDSWNDAEQRSYPLLIHWNGTEWEEYPCSEWFNSEGFKSTTFRDISFSSPNDGWCVGMYTGKGNEPHGFVLRYDWKYEGICGEEILFNPTWGGPLSVGNIRLGMLPVSFYIMKDFYIFLMNQSSDYGDDICYSGIVQCDTLKKYWPSGNTEYLEEMVYVNQLFGCSRTSIWRGDPEIFDVSTQVIQNLNNTYTLRVTVLNSSTSNPVESASVCLWMSNETPPKYYVKFTNSSGIADFNVGLGCTNANLTTSYEKYNYKPDIRTVTVP